jgi:hypothetical protein
MSRASFLLLTFLTSSCGSSISPKECFTASDCIQGGIPGSCLASPASTKQWCAFPDQSCTSMVRWGVAAGDGLASMCVVAGPADAGVDATMIDSSGPMYGLSVNNGGGGTVTSSPSGIDCGADCVGIYTVGTVVTLTETPSSGMSFGGWGGACASSLFSPTCQITITGDTTVSVAFGAPGTVTSLVTYGSANDDFGSVATDSAGNVFVAGKFDTTMTVADTMLVGAPGLNAFVAKIDRSGHALWAKSFAGGFSNALRDPIAVDAAGDVWITGQMTGTMNFGGAAVMGTVFLVKLSGVDGSHLVSHGFGASTNTAAYGLAIDSSGNVVIAGGMLGNEDFGGGPLMSAGGRDVFVAKYDTNGVHQWSKRFGGTADDKAYDLAVDTAGNIALTGFFGSAGIDFGTGPISLTATSNLFVAKLAPTGSGLWASGWAGSGQSIGSAIAIDPSGAVIVGGQFSGSVTVNGTPLNAVSTSDMGLAKYASAGTILWAQRYSATLGDVFATDTTIIFTGGYQAGVDFGGGPLPSAGGASDAFVVAISGTASFLWNDHFGGASNDGGTSIAVDSVSGEVIVGGTFVGAATFGGMAATAVAGSLDGFIVRLLP